MLLKLHLSNYLFALLLSRCLDFLPTSVVSLVSCLLTFLRRPFPRFFMFSWNGLSQKKSLRTLGGRAWFTLAFKKGFSIVDVVSESLTNASYDKQATQKVLIQSDDSSVLSIFKEKSPSYQRVLMIKETISDAPKPSVDEIKQFADTVNLPRSSMVASSAGFVTAYTDVVNDMHDANITVYVSVLWNEFMTVAFDFFSDPIMEVATYVVGIGVDGVVTEFPATA